MVESGLPGFSIDDRPSSRIVFSQGATLLARREETSCATDTAKAVKIQNHKRRMAGQIAEILRCSPSEIEATLDRAKSTDPTLVQEYD
jgi:hypothetical protein